MKIKSFLCIILTVSHCLGSAAFAQDAAITGTVVAVAGGTITIQKGTEVWDIKQTATTKVSGDLKVGSVVTINYNGPDAQKKEDPVSNPSPSAAAQ
jgi:hypothetical protein